MEQQKPILSSASQKLYSGFLLITQNAGHRKYRGISEQNYLGIICDSYLEWTDHISETVEKTNTRVSLRQEQYRM